MKILFEKSVMVAIAVLMWPLCLYAGQTVLEEQYSPVLDLYTEGAASGWDVSGYNDHDLAYVYGNNPITMGYAFRDINGDGIWEMLVGTTHPDYNPEARYGNCYEIYTLYNGTPVRLAQGAERYRYSVCEDGTVALFWTGGAPNNGWDFFTLPEGASALQQFMTVGSNYSEETGSEYYFINTEEPFSKLTGNLITQEEFDSIVDGYSFVDIQFVPITDYMDGTETDETVSSGSVSFNVDLQTGTDLYRDVISLYTQAESEMWDTNQYINNNMAFIYGAYRLPIAYCFADINSDGITEMITDRPLHRVGGDFNAIYTLASGDPVLLLDRGEFQTMYLCKDGTIVFYSYDEADLQRWLIFVLPKGGNNLILQETVWTDGEYWYRNNSFPSDETYDEPVTENEAMSAVNAHEEMDLTFFQIDDVHKYDNLRQPPVLRLDHSVGAGRSDRWAIRCPGGIPGIPETCHGIV